jgi:copper chaperone NosL
MKSSRAVLVMAALLTACERAPRPLVAGVDACDFCRMTVSDIRFGGEIQSRTGRLHAFDAVECLASFHLDAADRDEVKAAWVSDFETGRLVPVDSAVFLQDSQLKSPMGRNLVAFAPEHALRLTSSYDGRVITWEDVRALLRRRSLEPGVSPDTIPDSSTTFR